MTPFVAPPNDPDSCRSADGHNSDTVIQCDSVEIRRKDPQTSACECERVWSIFCLIGQTFASTPAKSASSLRSAVISRNFWSTLDAVLWVVWGFWDISRPGGGAAWYPHWHGFLVLRVQWLQIKRVFLGLCCLGKVREHAWNLDLGFRALLEHSPHHPNCSRSPCRLCNVVIALWNDKFLVEFSNWKYRDMSKSFLEKFALYKKLTPSPSQSHHAQACDQAAKS